MTPEAKVKKEVVKVLKAFGAYYITVVQTGYGGSMGAPDIIACYKGVFIGIECKAGKNMPTALQQKNIAAIVHAGGRSWTVNEITVKFLPELLQSI